MEGLHYQLGDIAEFVRLRRNNCQGRFEYERLRERLDCGTVLGQDG